jgi:hypothetical protein
MEGTASWPSSLSEQASQRRAGKNERSLVPRLHSAAAAFASPSFARLVTNAFAADCLRQSTDDSINRGNNKLLLLPEK